MSQGTIVLLKVGTPVLILFIYVFAPIDRHRRAIRLYNHLSTYCGFIKLAEAHEGWSE